MWIHSGFTLAKLWSEIITLTSKWTQWRLKSAASRLRAQACVEGIIKETIKAPRHRPLWEESTGGQWIPPQIASNAEMFPFDDTIMYVCLNCQEANQGLFFCGALHLGDITGVL